jgi:hypothetical protein
MRDLPRQEPRPAGRDELANKREAGWMERERERGRGRGLVSGAPRWQEMDAGGAGI